MQNEPVIVARTFRAPIEKVWKAITDLEQMVQWYMPTLRAFEPEVGFETSFDVEDNDKNWPHEWKVTEVIPNKKISYEWKFTGYPGNSLVTFELEKEGDVTRVTLTHYGIETFRGDLHPGLTKKDFNEGWTSIIGTALKDFLEGTPAR